MLLHVACLILLPGILSKSLIPQIYAAPATYDQRQDGDFNVDAKFENFLVVVATSGSSGLFKNLATQALELNELISQRSKQQNAEKPSETMVYETEDADGGREPYHVEIVHIEKEGDSTAQSKHTDKSSDAKNTEKIELETSSMDSKNSEPGLQEVSIDGKKTVKRTRSLWNTEEHRGLVDSSIKENKRSTNVRSSQVKNLDHSDDLPVKEEEVLKAARPGISLKKQLSKKEEEDILLISEERNELGNKLAEQELVLLGGGIENCGPGRYRDKLGVCQNDSNFN
ncbi:uncharacterized protein LOC122567555 [Bombus pyrosoma]|uniref:uncharacterized protein LOC122567555 n=1 Tax=Bombus pyrosoma TaxID=396416 RepID=UPI001CB9C596|nr:uncharacterized protein LOC122567555 [Bombus pyrosoma]